MDHVRAWGKRSSQTVGVAAIGLLVAACGHGQVASLPDRPVPPVADTSSVNDPHVLAGEWEYEEGGMVVSLVLDEQGNGDYAFKGGRFETGALADHTWTGKWSQRENDREGGFEVTLSPDYSEGDGRWWYTRIERDTKPSKAGGHFKVVRVKNSGGGPPDDRQTWVQY
jgi:hypothetical protein